MRVCVKQVNGLNQRAPGYLRYGEQSHLNSVNKAQWSQKWILPLLICENFTPIARALYLLDCEHRRISGGLFKEEYVFVCYTYPARTAKFPYEYATSKTLHHILRLKVAGYPLAKHSIDSFSSTTLSPASSDGSSQQSNEKSQANEQSYIRTY